MGWGQPAWHVGDPSPRSALVVRLLIRWTIDGRTSPVSRSEWTRWSMDAGGDGAIEGKKSKHARGRRQENKRWIAGQSLAASAASTVRVFLGGHRLDHHRPSTDADKLGLSLSFSLSPASGSHFGDKTIGKIGNGEGERVVIGTAGRTRTRACTRARTTASTAHIDTHTHTHTRPECMKCMRHVPSLLRQTGARAGCRRETLSYFIAVYTVLCGAA